MNQVISKAIMDKSSTAASYTASGATAVGGALSANELALFVGVTFTVLTFLFNAWLGMRRDRRERELHDAQLGKLSKD